MQDEFDATLKGTEAIDAVKMEQWSQMFAAILG